MRKSKRKLLIFLAIFTFLNGFSQVRVPVTNNDLRINLQKIIRDYPNQFNSLLGDTLVENPQTIEFSSRLQFEGAMENSIIQYKSIKPVYSWQAVLISTEEFEEAANKYKWLYNQLKVMTINLEGGYSFSMNGNWEAADESRKFSSCIFKLTPNAINMPKLKIEASIHFEFPEWKVSLMVYEKEREDNEQGDVLGE